MTPYEQAVELVERAAALGLEWEVRDNGRIRTSPASGALCPIEALADDTGFAQSCESLGLRDHAGSAAWNIAFAADGVADTNKQLRPVQSALRALMLQKFGLSGGGR